MANGSRRRTPSRRARSGGGAKSGFGKVVWAVFVLALIVGFLKIPHDPTIQGTWNIAVAKSQQIQEWATGTGKKLEDGTLKPGSVGSGSGSSGSGTTGSGSSTGSGATGTGGSGTVNTVAVNKTLDSLKVASDQKVAYNRDEWHHWINVRTCWTVREQVVASEAQKGSLKLLDSSGKSTTDVNKACEIVSGTWVDPYTGKTFTNPGQLDVDHMVPLEETASEGGQAWSTAKKQAYANNLDYPDHLIAVSASANRSKGSKGVSEWKPDNKGFWCEYATAQVNIRAKWSLTVTSADKSALKTMLATCK